MSWTRLLTRAREVLDGTLGRSAVRANGQDAQLAPGHRVGEYRIRHKLGEGGFGAVYEAVHPVIGKKAAVKVLRHRYSCSAQMVSRFVAEARAANQIRHRDIVDIFAFGVLPDGRHYYVMELLEGVPLDAYIDRIGRLTPEEALPILHEVAKALDAAHAAGIAHRDLKPENVFLVTDGEGRLLPKILDFGVAKLLTAGEVPVGHKTREGAPIGSPRYMSPEQCRGVDVDHRTDVYSFGVLAFRMLTGRLPFEGRTGLDLMVKHVGSLPPRMSEVCADLSAVLDVPVLRMLEKEPADRFDTMQAAFSALAQAAQTDGHDASAWSGNGGAVTSTYRALNDERRDAIAPSESARSASQVSGAHPVSERFSSLSFPRRALAVGVLLLASGALVLGVVLALRSSSPLVPESVRPSPNLLATSALAPMAGAEAPSQRLPSASGVGMAPASDSVTLTVQAQPPDADVYVGDVRLGAASAPIRLSRSSVARLLTIKAAGFSAATVEVVPTADATVAVTLKPQPPRMGKARPQLSKDLEDPY
jgi:eukaryotic-like serine/threonine-protein kinase